MADIASVRGNEKNQEIQKHLDQQAARKNLINNIIPYVGLVFCVVFFTIVTGGNFLSADNMGNLINQGFVLSLIAIGSAFVYAHGGMDFSVGAVSGVSQLVLALTVAAGVPLPLCLLLTILVCILGATCTASITLLLGVPVFVGSMCVRTSFTGILKTFTEKNEIALLYQDYAYMNNPVLKGLILVIIIAVAYYLFNYTTIGKYNKAIGGNPRTSQQAGVSRRKMVYIAYLLMGLCVGLASIFAFFRTCKVSAYSGNGYEFNVMMAIVLGGFPMAGGDRAKVSSAIIGALTVTALSNGLSMWGLDTTLISGVKGILFVIIVALSYDRSAGKLVS